MSTPNNQTQHVEARVQLGDNPKLAYDKAIEGYQFQVGRYNTWMNYYSIFVGALFIAFYTIWSSGNSCCCCCCRTAVADDDGKWILLLIIAGLGFIASACWYGALLGYRKWNGHWISTVKNIEKLVFPDSSNTSNTSNTNDNKTKSSRLEVYRNMPKEPQEEPKYIKGYISTQKITGIFIFFVMAAWAITIGWVLCTHFDWNCWYALLGIFAPIIVICKLHYCTCRFYSSDIYK